jgi:8-oxo-dGTP pyrophosphatase MutT (NUDIX family)
MRSVHYRAAGGVVLDATDRVLLLERVLTRGDRRVHEVRLPKGHIEPGESDVEAALREVREESGYQALAVLLDLGVAENRFLARSGEQVTRDEHYYLMRLLSAERGEPTALGEEALFQPLWVADLEAAEATLTFASERAFIARARAAQDRSSSPAV